MATTRHRGDLKKPTAPATPYAKERGKRTEGRRAHPAHVSMLGEVGEAETEAQTSSTNSSVPRGKSDEGDELPHPVSIPSARW